jgi:hypothetical protein
MSFLLPVMDNSIGTLVAGKITFVDHTAVQELVLRHPRWFHRSCPGSQELPIVAGWARGAFEGEAVHDDDGHGASDIRIHARVTVTEEGTTVDLSGSDPQVRGFVSSSHANM